MNGLKNSGVPVGGLGTGSVEIREDGLFHEWMFMNNKPWAAGPEVEPPEDAGYFGLNVKHGNENRSALLCTPGRYNCNLNDPYGLAFIEHPDIATNVEFPFTRFKYKWDNFPVSVKMSAFNPFVPLDIKNSSIPCAFFEFELCNNMDEAVEVALFQQQCNMVGYTDGNKKSVMTFSDFGSAAAIRMTRKDMDEYANDAGTMVYGAKVDAGCKTTYMIHPITNRNYWEPLLHSNCFENLDLKDYLEQIDNEVISWMAAPDTIFANSGLCVTRKLEPGEKTVIIFNLSWFFPNFHDKDYPKKGVSARLIGNHYSNYYSDAMDVFTYCMENYDYLKAKSMAFSESYFGSDMPKWLLEAIIAQFTTLAKSSWFDKSGRFGIWEGLGCCGLQTTDITYYSSHAIIQLFPELQKSQMRLTLENIELKGKIPHMMPGSFSCCDLDMKERIDLIPQYVMLLWRDMLWNDDKEYISEMYQSIKDCIEFFKQYDSDGDGLPNNNGPDQTYDQFPMKGTSSFVGYLYAGALQAASEIAAYMNDMEFSVKCKGMFNDAIIKLDEQLWNGEYFRLSHDMTTGENNEGVMVDQLSGDWFVRQGNGSNIVEDYKAISSLLAVNRYCSAKQGYLHNCYWPDGNGIKINRHTANQADWPWSGTEYTFAAYLILTGLNEEGVRLVRNIWDRYEKMGLRFNHIECGQHYYRALSSWTVYLALTGFSLNRPENELEFLANGPKKFIFADGRSWGSVEIGDKDIQIAVKSGTLSVKRLIFKKLISNIIGDDSITVIQNNDVTVVEFKQLTGISAGEKINLKTASPSSVKEENICV